MIEITDKVKKVLQNYSISEQEFQYMVHHAALVTHSLGNRRYKKWLFNIQDGKCVYVTKWVKEVIKPSSHDFVVYEDCEYCDGAGCKKCDWVGRVMVVYTSKGVKNGQKTRGWNRERSPSFAPSKR